MSITIVGLGPGHGGLMTRQAWDAITTAELLYLRTAKHLTVDDFPPTREFKSFDYLYESAEKFSDVYTQIVQELIRVGKTRPLVYAVPGHPNIGESTVTMLLDQAKNEGIALRIIHGLSFVEPVLTAVDADALDGLQIFDALAVANTFYPPCSPNIPTIIGQVYNQLVAGEVKLALSSVFPEQHLVYLVHDAGNPNELIEPTPLYAIDRSQKINHLTSLFIPPLKEPSALSDLAETVAILRSPDGCPWDIEQTPQSMRNGLLEEVYEVIEALDKEDYKNLQEELGDLLYHLVMQAQMAFEAGEFTLSDVIADIDAKLKRRHPHVWGDLELNNSDEVLHNWQLIKQQEKPAKSESILNDIPVAVPALMRSQKIQQRVAGVGFDWPDIEGIYDKINEEIGEIKEAVSPDEVSAEIGDLLFVIVNLAKWLQVDAESSLREANIRFINRFQIVEKLATLNKIDLSSQSLDELEALWEVAKEKLAQEDTNAKV